MSASSRFNMFFQAAYGQLNDDRGFGWCAKEPGRNDDWLQVDLGKPVEVCGLATQGGNTWVKAFKLFYSFDGKSWKTYRDVSDTDAVRENIIDTNIGVLIYD